MSNFIFLQVSNERGFYNIFLHGSLHAGMTRDQELLNALNKIKELEAGMSAMRRKMNSLEDKNHYLEEQLRLWKLLHFGSKSEKLTKDDYTYGALFNEAEDGAFSQTLDTVFEVKADSQKTRKAKSKRGLSVTSQLPEGIPEEEKVYKLKPEEKVCGCGKTMNSIGYETSKRLRIKPAEVVVVVEKREKAACSCDGIDLEGKPENAIVRAAGKEHLIPGGIADESLIAWSISEKYEYALPFYRQEKRFKQIGVSISRTNLCNWAIKAADACEPLMERLKQHVKSGNVINADETTLQVLNEKGKKAQSKSYMWLFVGGPPDKQAVYFQYNSGRSAAVPEKFLKGYSGYLQTDGYQAYDTALKSLNEGRPAQERIHHALCWAHARRRFDKCWKTTKDPHARKALDWCKDLFALEKLRNRKDFQETRQTKGLDILREFYDWAMPLYTETLPKSLLGEALSYAIENRPGLEAYLDHSELTPSNNIAENAVRPFVIGRKNFLFSATPAGADASAGMYSLIETAKLQGLNPFHYLLYTFERILQARNNHDYEKLMPWNLTPEMIQPT